MNRICIVGCSGAGKSTLARAIGSALDVPVIHLDTLFWKPGWVESDRTEFRVAVEAAVAGERWVSDGNFFAASEKRLARADTVIWLDLPRLVCLSRAVWRSVTAFVRSRADLAPGCPEKFDLVFYAYIWSWNRQTRPKVEAAIANFAPHAPVLKLRNNREIRAFMVKLSGREP